MSEDGPSFIEMGVFTGPLERFRKDLLQRGEVEMAGAMESAIQIGGGPWAERGPDFSPISSDLFRTNPTWKARLLRIRQEFRREGKLTPDQIRALQQMAEQAGEESYLDCYALLEVVDAAATEQLSGMERIAISCHMGYTSANAKQFTRCRQAYAEGMEEVSIPARLSVGDPKKVLDAQEVVKRQWSRIKKSAGISEEPFDIEGDPSGDWVDLVLWNSDFGSSHGLLDQVEATLRLAIRFEDWIDRRRQTLDVFVPKLLDGCLRSSSEEGSILPARCAVALGDALVEVQQWSLAASVFRKIGQMTEAELVHPVWLHAAIQEAYCALMQSDVAGCRALLDRMDVGRVQEMADLIITVQAELARYHSIDILCRARMGAPASAEEKSKVLSSVRQVGVIAPRRADDRTGWLRTLFVAVLQRDIQYVLSIA